EESVPPLSRQLPRNPELDEQFHRGRHRGKRKACRGAQPGSRLKRPYLERLMDAKRGARLASGSLDVRAMLAEHLPHAIRGGDCALRDLTHSFEKECQPCLPVAVVTHAVQEVVVGCAMLLQIETEIEKRLAQNAGVTEKERDQEATHASVSVEE